MTTATATAAAGTKGRKITVEHDGATISAGSKNATWIAVGTGNEYHDSGLWFRTSSSEAAIRKVAAETGAVAVLKVVDPA